jgi:hypothetical protein
VRLNEAFASLFDKLHKVLRSLSPEDAEALAEGRAQLMVVRPGTRLVEEIPGLDLALRTLRTLSDEDRARLATGGSSLKLVHRGGKVLYPVNAGQVAVEVSRLTTEDAIIKFLDEDDRLKPADLRKVAKELGIALPGTAKTKAAIETYIARNLVSFGTR